MSDRYARHGLIPDWRQVDLAKATVIIAGMGALGNEVARILAMSGVSNLVLCDPDRVEASNLSRMALFRDSDIGRFKVEAAAEALAELAPDLRVETRPMPLVHGVGLAELRDASLVLSCLDSRSARLQLAGRCQLVQADLIDGGTHPWGGEVRPFLDRDGPCYACSLTLHERGTADEPWSCLDDRIDAPIGSATPSSALIGTWMGTLAVRHLMGLPCPSDMLLVDCARGTTVLVRRERDPDCPFHHPLTSISSIAASCRSTVSDLLGALPSDAEPLLWEPMQERVECAHCGFQEARWGPPGVEPCPRCGALLRPRTSLEVTSAPRDLVLSDLGIPPREILAVRHTAGMQFVEMHA